jgi:hypothetical protein
MSISFRFPNIKADIIKESQGSFHLAQMLCHDTCVDAGILEEKEEQQVSTSSIEVIRERVLSDLSKTFFEKAKIFATGPRLRREGRAPYFHLLHWLASGKEWSLNVRDTIRQKPEHRGSVGQIVSKGLLADHISKNPSLQDVIHFDPETTELSVEDPKFVFYIRNLTVRLFFWALNGNSTPLEAEKLTKFGAFSPLWRTRFRDV